MNAPDRAIWLAQRKAGLGGSDIGAVLGFSPYRTPVDVWMEKTGRAESQDETLQMRFGTFAEEFVAQEYTRRTGLAVQRFNTMLHHPNAPILGNIDRLVVPAGQKRASHKQEIRTDCLLECKTASAFAAGDTTAWGEEGTDQVPMSYLIQVATYRILTGCNYADLAVLFGNQEVRIYNLWRDAELEEMIVAKASEWWQRHVVADVPPEPTCDADIKALYPRDDGSIVQANEKSLQLLARAQELREAIDKLEVELNGDKKAGSLGVLGSLKAYMGDASALVLGEMTLATWKAAKASQKTDYAKALIEFGASLGIASDDPRLRAAIEANTISHPGARRFLIKD